MEKILERQKVFQRLLGLPIDTVLEDERNEMAESFVFKLIEEAIEVRKEFPSRMNKWSKKQKRANIPRIKDEMSDVYLFLMNLLAVWKIDVEDFMDNVESVQSANFVHIRSRLLEKLNTEVLHVPGHTSCIGQGSVVPNQVFIGLNPSHGISHGYKAWSDPQSGSSKALLPILEESNSRSNSYFTNAVKSTTIGNEKPSQDLIDFWKPFLLEELRILGTGNPNMKVFVLGNEVSKHYLNELGNLGYRTYHIPHPAAVLRGTVNNQVYKDLINSIISSI